MLYSVETLHLMRELERSLSRGGEFPLKNHDESSWMYTTISGFVVPKYATEKNIRRIINAIKSASADHEWICYSTMQEFIQDSCEESWFWHSVEFEEEGFTEDPDESAD